jgi:hypothetical protein
MWFSILASDFFFYRQNYQNSLNFINFLETSTRGVIFFKKIFKQNIIIIYYITSIEEKNMQHEQ